jgi:transcriptional regulator with XRE-family HTH domain
VDVLCYNGCRDKEASVRYRIREARENKVLSQVDLAEASGVSRTTIIEIEQGKVTPRPATVRRLAKALGVPPEELIDRTPPAQR